jgi:hypothetical protein
MDAHQRQATRDSPVQLLTCKKRSVMFLSLLIGVHAVSIWRENTFKILFGHAEAHGTIELRYLAQAEGGDLECTVASTVHCTVDSTLYIVLEFRTE